MQISINAHLLTNDPSYRAAGIHTYIEQTLRALPAVAPSDWQFKAYVGAQYPLELEGYQMVRSQWQTQSPIRRILWEQLVQPFQLTGDLFHATAFVTPLVQRLPSVVTIYDLSFVHYPARLPRSRRLYLSTMTRRSCEQAQRVIAISQATADDLTQLWNIPSSKIDIAVPGYDKTRFKPLSQAEQEAFRAQKSLSERFWFFVGTLEPRKNLPMLLEAYASLQPHERLPLVIGGGKGWDYQPIFDAVKTHRLEKEVQFIGYVPTDELPIWYNCAELFIYPSVFEGFGLPVLEAMACGTPILTSDQSSLPEVAGNVGMCISPHDGHAWADALRFAFHNRAWREEQSLAGIERAQNFSWTHTAEQTLYSYQQALQA